jgi:hypothetical protein
LPCGFCAFCARWRARSEALTSSAFSSCSCMASRK